MLRAADHRAPGRRADDEHLSNRGRTIRPKTLNQKRYVDAIDEHTIVFGIGPAGTGKTYLAMAKAVAGAAGQAGQPDHPDPPGGRGGRAAGLPARHAQRQDRPLPAAALRRAARHGRPRVDPAADGRRHHRGRPAGLHARPHAQRRVHHPRRGAEHLARADEDVPHPARASARRWSSPATSPRSTCPAAPQSGLRVVQDILDGVDDVHFSELTSQRRRPAPAGRRHRRRLRPLGRARAATARPQRERRRPPGRR